MILKILLAALSLASALGHAEILKCTEVSLRNQKVLCLGGGVGAFTASERATAVEGRLEKLCADRTFDTDKLHAEKKDASVDILAGSLVVASLTANDLAPNQEKDLDALADTAVKSMHDAIEQQREVKSQREIFYGSIYSVVVSLSVLLMLVAFYFLYPKLYARIRNAKGQRLRSLKIQSYEILTANRIVEILVWLAQVSRFVFTILILYISVPLVLSFFPWTANLAPKILSYIFDPLKEIMHVFIDYIPKLFFAIMIGVFARFVLKIVSFLFTEMSVGPFALKVFIASGLSRLTSSLGF